MLYFNRTDQIHTCSETSSWPGLSFSRQPSCSMGMGLAYGWQEKGCLKTSLAPSMSTDSTPSDSTHTGVRHCISVGFAVCVHSWDSQTEAQTLNINNYWPTNHGINGPNCPVTPYLMKPIRLEGNFRFLNYWEALTWKEAFGELFGLNRTIDLTTESRFLPMNVMLDPLS